MICGGGEIEIDIEWKVTKEKMEIGKMDEIQDSWKGWNLEQLYIRWYGGWESFPLSIRWYARWGNWKSRK
jgi:hypothetical protein